MIVSDRDAYDSMIAYLAATPHFSGVMLDDAARTPGGSWPAPLAIISPGPWSAASTDDPALTLRRVSYRITLVVQGDDPRSRFQEADRLAQEITLLLNGADFGSGCVPMLSKIDQGAIQLSAGSGEATCELRGTFSYLAPSPATPAITSN